MHESKYSKSTQKTNMLWFAHAYKCWRNVRSYLSLFGLLQQSTIDRVAYKQQKFLTVLEAESQRSGCEHECVLVRTLFQIADCSLLSVFSYGRRRKGALWGIFYTGTNPMHEGSTQWLTSQMSHFLIPSHWGVGFQHTNFRRTHSVCNRWIPGNWHSRRIWCALIHGVECEFWYPNA